MTDAFRELAGRSQIEQLLLQYAHGLDRKDFELVAGCFAEDAQSEYSGRQLGPGGRPVADYARGKLERFVSTMHVISNVRIELEGDRASSECYGTVSLVEEVDDRRRVILRSLRYLDRMAHRDGRWLLVERRHLPAEWMVELPMLETAW